MKDKQYYIDKHKELFDACLIEAGENNANDVTAGAETLYNECATTEHIVGYYLYFYGESALKTWKENLSLSIKKKGKETDTDKEVTQLLEELVVDDLLSIVVKRYQEERRNFTLTQQMLDTIRFSLHGELLRSGKETEYNYAKNATLT